MQQPHTLYKRLCVFVSFLGLCRDTNATPLNTHKRDTREHAHTRTREHTHKPHAIDLTI